MTGICYWRLIFTPRTGRATMLKAAIVFNVSVCLSVCLCLRVKSSSEDMWTTTLVVVASFLAGFFFC